MALSFTEKPSSSWEGHRRNNRWFVCGRNQPNYDANYTMSRRPTTTTTTTETEVWKAGVSLCLCTLGTATSSQRSNSPPACLASWPLWFVCRCKFTLKWLFVSAAVLHTGHDVLPSWKQPSVKMIDQLARSDALKRACNVLCWDCSFLMFTREPLRPACVERITYYEYNWKNNICIQWRIFAIFIFMPLLTYFILKPYLNIYNLQGFISWRRENAIKKILWYQYYKPKLNTQMKVMELLHYLK